MPPSQLLYPMYTVGRSVGRCGPALRSLRCPAQSRLLPARLTYGSSDRRCRRFLDNAELDVFGRIAAWLAVLHVFMHSNAQQVR